MSKCPTNTPTRDQYSNPLDKINCLLKPTTGTLGVVHAQPSGALPFTGIDLGLVIALAVIVASAGLLMRWSSK